MLAARLFAILLFASATSAAAAQEEANVLSTPVARAFAPMMVRQSASDRVVVTHHRATVNGRWLSYHAIVSEMTLDGPDKKPAAVVASYGYVVDRPAGANERPVLFVFNGGPGASSLQLHMHGIGPRRVEGTKVVENGATPLDVTDLVFIDPVGTGASMPVQGGDPTNFFGVTGDARSMIDVIVRWKAANGRQKSPTLLLGESYGTYRAVQMLQEDSKTQRLGVCGVILLSLVTDNPGRDVVAPMTLLPTLASVAWYHQRVDRAGRTVSQQFDAALEFARTDYARALIGGVSLDPAERARIARRMSALIGIPVSTLEADGLVVGQAAFMATLLGGDRRTGKLDGRVTREIAASHFQVPYDDPSMTLGVDSTEPVMRYLRTSLGYSPPSPYRALNLGINAKWAWDDGFYGWFDVSPAFAAALTGNPALRIMSMGGYYDITTPAYAARFALDHTNIPITQRVEHLYPTGHSVLDDPATLDKAVNDIRQFVLDTTK